MWCLVQNVIECLAEAEVSQTEHLPLLKELISCVAAVVQTLNDACAEHSLLLFTVIQRVKGSRHSDSLQQEASGLVLASFIIVSLCNFRFQKPCPHWLKLRT